MAKRPAHVAAPPFATPRVPIRGSERQPRPLFEAVGPADPDETVRVVIKVRPKEEVPDPSELGAMLPTERPAPLSYEACADRYGADPRDIDKVVDFARAHHLQVVEANAAQRMVILKGPVKDVNAAFGTELQVFKSTKTSATYRGRVGQVHIPEDLGGIVTVVTGLDNRRLAKPRAAQADQVVPTSFTPPQLARLYNFPAQLDGSGQCIGILEFGGGFDTTDLATYFRGLGIPLPSVTAVSVDGTPNDPNDPRIPIRDRADPEVMLDIEVAGAIAPGAQIAVYFAQFTERGWTEAITKAVHDRVNRPSVLSISWGFAEIEDAGTVTFTPQVMEDINRTLKEAAMLGVTVIVAAGDDGSIDGVLDGNVHVDFPASSPFVLSCGGTTLFTRNGRITDEVVWSDGIRDDSNLDRQPHGSTGGGVSEHFPLPSWQTGAALNVPKSASTGFAGRGLPDVAAVADGRTGYSIRVFGQDVQGEGGTSASAPLWAGLIARINQQLARMPGAKSVGFFNPLLYQRIGPTPAFNDVTSGTNDAHGDLNGAYAAGPGWDACTGWGSPNGVNLLLALTGGVAPHQVGVTAPLAGSAAGERNGRPDQAMTLENELKAERASNRQLIDALHRLVSLIPAGQAGPPRDPGSS